MGKFLKSLQAAEELKSFWLVGYYFVDKHGASVWLPGYTSLYGALEALRKRTDRTNSIVAVVLERPEVKAWYLLAPGIVSRPTAISEYQH